MKFSLPKIRVPKMPKMGNSMHLKSNIGSLTGHKIEVPSIKKSFDIDGLKKLKTKNMKF